MEATLGMERAALQQHQGAVARPPAVAGPPRPASTVPTPHREFFIQGITLDGRTFRPSDWAERLAGAMSCFRPVTGGGRLSDFIGYSPYCVPRVINGVKCVLVNEALRDIEPMAWDFVMQFARDNALRTSETSPAPARTAD